MSRCYHCGHESDEEKRNETWEDKLLNPVKRHPIIFILAFIVMIGTDLLLTGGGLTLINKVGLGLLLNAAQVAAAYTASLVANTEGF